MPGGAGSAQAEPVRACAPLVGRDGELAELAAALASGRHVLVEGAAGVGKSRLADEVLASPGLADRRLDRVLACAGTTRVPLGALLPLGAGRSARDGTGLQIEWYLGRWRSRRSAAAPALVWLDDAHHLDAVSAAVLRQAVRTGDVQLFATARTHEPLPEDLVALLVDATLDRVHLAPLDPPACRRLAAVYVPRPRRSQSVERIARLAAGYPLFVRELALSNGAGALPPEGPGAAMLRERLEALSPEARHAAELVALAQPVPAALLAGLEEGLAALDRAGLLVTHDHDLLRLDHPLQAEWLVGELGATRSERYGELAERAAETPDLVDPLLAVEWQLGGSVHIPPAAAAHAVRLALARTDAATARRLLDHVTEGHDLLLGQALALEGDLDRAIELLERVRREAPDPALRVEAASLLVRHVGLTRSNPAAAHEILDRTDAPDLDPHLRRHLLLGRMWLRLFGPALGPPITPSTALLHEATGEGDQLAYDLATAGAAVFVQTHGSDEARPFLSRALAIEQTIDVDEGSWCRARAIETWCHGYAGDLVGARAVLARGIDRAWQEGWQEGLWLLVGNAALVGVTAGEPFPDFVPDAWDHRTLEPGGPADGDLYRLRALAAAAWRASCALADPSGDCPCLSRGLEDSGGAMPLLDTMVARADALAAEAHGQPEDGVRAGARLAAALRLLAEHDVRAWLAVFYLDCADLRSPAWLHPLVAGRLASAETGLFALARDAARARAESDATALLSVARDLVARGYVVPATRAFADVTRMGADSATQLGALRGLAATDAAWHAAPMPWTRDVAGLPTPHQLEIARAVASGRTAQEVAERWFLSRRTVENHLYRVGRLLQASSREHLGEILAHPCPALLEPPAPNGVAAAARDE